MTGNSSEETDDLTPEDEKNAGKLTAKLIKFGENFKNWQREDTERCDSCYMTYLLCQYKKRKKKEDKGKAKGK